MTTGVIALAVPGSGAFAGEFSILAGVLNQGWGYAVVGAIAIVLAAMYVLRLISAVLHRSKGPAVTDAALDLRPGELAIIVPLIALMLFLSPGRPRSRSGCSSWLRSPARPSTGSRSRPRWRCSPSRARACSSPSSSRRPDAARPPPRSARAATSPHSSSRSSYYDRTPTGESVVADAIRRDRFFALGAILIAIAGLLAVLVSYHERAEGHISEYYCLLAAAGAGMIFLVQANTLMTLFLGLEWFSISLYILCAIDSGRERSLEAGLKYLIVGGFGSAVLLFGSALVYGTTGELTFQGIAQSVQANKPVRRRGARHRPGDDHRRARVQGLGRAVPHVDADVYEGAPTSVTAFMAAATKIAALLLTFRILVTAFPQEHQLWTIALAVIAVASLAIGNLAALVQRNVKRLLAYSSVSNAGFMLIAVSSYSALGGRPSSTTS